MLSTIINRLRGASAVYPASAPSATTAEMEEFEAKGFFIRESIFDLGELKTMRNAVENIHAEMNAAAASEDAPEMELVDDKRYQSLSDSVVKWEWRDGSQDIRSMEPFLHLHPDLSSLVDDPRLWGPARSVLGVDKLSLFTDKLNFKRPGGAPFPFHQDSPYFALDCPHFEQLVSMQIYLDDARVDNGCLWMVPGSHQDGILKCVQNKGTLDRLYTDMELYEGEAPVPVEVPAGSVIFFHCHVIHGSMGNKTNESRRAMVITYQPEGFDHWKLKRARPISMNVL